MVVLILSRNGLDVEDTRKYYVFYLASNEAN